MGDFDPACYRLGAGPIERHAVDQVRRGVNCHEVINSLIGNECVLLGQHGFVPEVPDGLSSFLFLFVRQTNPELRRLAETPAEANRFIKTLTDYQEARRAAHAASLWDEYWTAPVFKDRPTHGVSSIVARLIQRKRHELGLR